MDFCFFATRGINPLNIAGIKTRKKKEAKKVIAASEIPFDEGIKWYKNFYKMISHYWALGLNKNLNLVMLYL